jgi:fermentation-respiration switch protein FrsA (DUF1100 family)
MELKSSARWKRWLFRGLLVVVICYVLACAALLLLEDRLLYRPAKPNEWWSPPPRTLTSLQDVNLRANGLRIHAWWSPPEDWKPAQGAALYCHGNGGNVSLWGGAIASWNTHRDEAVLLFDYPGYGKSEGQPTEAGCYAAAEAAYVWLAEKQKVAPERLLLVGQSLGSAVATHLGAQRAHRALVLLSPFASMPDMAAEKFPIFPGRWLIHNRFDNLENLGHCHQPVFIAHGTADQMVPFSQAERVLAAAHQPKRLYRMEGAGHMIYLDAAFFSALHDFLEKAQAYSKE